MDIKLFVPKLISKVDLTILNLFKSKVLMNSRPLSVCKTRMIYAGSLPLIWIIINMINNLGTTELSPFPNANM